MPHRAPPLHGNFIFRTVQIHLQIGNSVENVGSALDRGGVNAALDAELRTGSRHDGLADDGVRPRDGIAAGVEPRDEMVVPHRAIPSAAKIVFARPHNFHRELSRLWQLRWLRKRNRSQGSRAGQILRPKAWCAASLARVSGPRLGGSRAITGLKLRAGPNLAAICVQIHYGVQRLHHAVRQVGNFVLGGDRLCRARKAAAGSPTFRATKPGVFDIAENISRISTVDSAAPGPSSQIISSCSRPSFAGQKPLAITAMPEGTCTTFTTPGTPWSYQH